jgi:hypothetical protein
MSTTPEQIAAIQADASTTSSLAAALVAGSVTAAEQTALEAAACSVYTAAYDIVPDTGPPPSGLPVPPGYSVLWDDQFLGTVLSAHWLAELAPGGNRWYSPPSGGVPAPYSGNTQPGYDVALRNPSQVKIGPVGTYPGGATLTAQRYSGQYSSQGFQWLTGTLSSFPSLLPTTGAGWFIQARIKFCDTSSGIWPAFWLLPQDSSQEFDIMGTGFTGSLANVNLMGTSDLFSGGQQQKTWDTPGSADVSAAFHVYGCKCVFGESITVYFDGTEVYSATASSAHPIVAKPYSILLDTQVMIPQGQNPKFNPAGWHKASSPATPSPISWEIAEVQVCVPV